MSENSTTLHFWRTGRDEIRRLVLSQKTAGRAIAANERWLCFVPLDAMDEQALIGHTAGTVIKWSYYDDYALGLELFCAGALLSQASFVWGTELTGQPPSSSVPPEFASELRRLGLPGADVDELTRIADDVGAGRAKGTEVRDRVANALRLAAYEWLSPEACLELPIEDFQRMYPDAEEIDSSE